jgi:hypothetical protein
MEGGFEAARWHLVWERETKRVCESDSGHVLSDGGFKRKDKKKERTMGGIEGTGMLSEGVVFDGREVLRPDLSLGGKTRPRINRQGGQRRYGGLHTPE